MAARRGALARRRGSRISRRRFEPIRRSSAARSRLLKGRPRLRSSAFNKAACSRALSLRDKRADTRDLPPRREFLAERRSRRLERRSLAESFLPLSEREALWRPFFARELFWARFLAASARCKGRTRRTIRKNAEIRLRGYRLLEVIRGLLPFYGFGLARLH